MEKFCYLGDIVVAKGGAFDSVTTLRDLVFLLASRCLSLGANTDYTLHVVSPEDDLAKRGMN